MKQRSEQWYTARAGKITASRISDIMARTKSGYSASRNNYIAELVAERMTGQCYGSFVSKAMEWGMEKEDEAKAAYEFVHDVHIEEAPFVLHPDLSFTGASPDGYLHDDGLIEIKCPNTSTHINTLLTKRVDNKYVLQMQWQLACTGRKYCQFLSYDPRMPDHLIMWDTTVERDDELIAEITKEVVAANQEIENIIKKLS